MTRIEWRRYGRGLWAAHLFINDTQACTTRHGSFCAPVPGVPEFTVVTDLTRHGTPFGRVCQRCMRAWNTGRVQREPHMTASRSAPSAHESDLMRAYIEAIPFAIPRMRVFRRNIMAAHLEGGHFVRAGIPGQCDLYGFIGGMAAEVRNLAGEVIGTAPRLHRPAIPIEIECKSATARWTDQQKKWRAFCEEWRIPYLALVARKDETPGQTVNRWVDETREIVGRLT